MTQMIRNPQGRDPTQLRPISIETQVNRYAEGSVLIKAGHTHVLCTASIDENVPSWLQGKGRGWITAEYSMLPRSTHTRSKRDREKISGRTQEIQRLIGRALRAMVNLPILGERSILVDCDVLQADGGTRTTSITGSCVALVIALEQLQKDGKIRERGWADTVSAVSLGMKDGQILVDLDYEEDSKCDVDMNFVMTGNGNLVEVQGTAEQKPFSHSELVQMAGVASVAGKELRQFQLNALGELGISI